MMRLSRRGKHRRRGSTLNPALPMNFPQIQSDRRYSFRSAEDLNLPDALCRSGLPHCVQISAVLLPIPLGLAGVRAKQQNPHSSSLWISVLIMVLLGAVGCSTAPKTSFRPASTPFPAEALVTQRGVLTVLGREFTLNGYLALNAAGGKRLVVTETFGGVLADLLITADGTAHVMRSSRALKPEWIRRYLAADVQCLTGGATVEECPGEMLSPTHYLVQRRWYKLDLQTVNVKPGPQPAAIFDASRAEKP